MNLDPSLHTLASYIIVSLSRRLVAVRYPGTGTILLYYGISVECYVGYRTAKTADWIFMKISRVSLAEKNTQEEENEELCINPNGMQICLHSLIYPWH